MAPLPKHHVACGVLVQARRVHDLADNEYQALFELVLAELPHLDGAEHPELSFLLARRRAIR
ncbi:hypothetical protein [Cryobacterium sp. W22_MBD10_FK3]|uniref:hypothetical protein n=1 Tax=Cryobacterium sp. W22_MBD10_FK3 TaxID=3240273 RepID=UPI003F90EDEB